MSKIRKWLVRNFVLDTWVKAFGKSAYTARAPRVLFPLFAFVGMIITADPNYPAFQWWDIILMSLLAIGLWLGFSFFSWSYFILWPVSWDELDDEQKHTYLKGVFSGLLNKPEYKVIKGAEQFLTKGLINAKGKKEFIRLTALMEEKYKGNFAGLKNLIPVAVSVLSIIIWAIWIFPYFNQ